MSERQYSLRAPGHLNDPIVMVELDTSNGVMFPLYDADTNMVYLCGKVYYILKRRFSFVFKMLIILFYVLIIPFFKC